MLEIVTPDEARSLLDLTPGGLRRPGVRAHLRDANRLLGSRLARLPERRRPFYSPVERFQILSLKERMGLTNEECAQLFRISPGTISRWMSHADPESETAGSRSPGCARRARSRATTSSASPWQSPFSRTGDHSGHALD